MVDWCVDHVTRGECSIRALTGTTGADQRRRGRRLGNDGQPLEPQNNNNNDNDVGPHDNDDFEHGGGHRPLNHNPYRRSFFYWNDPFLWLPFPVRSSHRLYYLIGTCANSAFIERS